MPTFVVALASLSASIETSVRAILNAQGSIGHAKTTLAVSSANDISREAFEQERTDHTKLSEEIDRALTACLDFQNILAIPEIMAGLPHDQGITFVDLRNAAIKTSPELSTAIDHILTIIEERPTLLPIAIQIAREKLDVLPMTDWRKHLLQLPLQKCEKIFCETDQLPGNLDEE